MGEKQGANRAHANEHQQEAEHFAGERGEEVTPELWLVARFSKARKDVAHG